MTKVLVLIAVIAILCVLLARLRTRLPWNEPTKRAERRGVLRQPLDAMTQERVIDLLIQGKKFGAIRVVRKVTGMSYRDARLLVQAMEAGHRPARVIQGEATEV